MTLVLQESADCHLLSPSNLRDQDCAFQPKTYELQLYDPREMSHGYRRWFHLHPGISLLVDDYKLQENLVVEICPTQPCTYLELGFNLLGHYPSMDLKRGQNFIGLELDTGEACWKEWEAQERVLKLDIHIEYSLFQSLIFLHLNTLPVNFRKLIEKANSDEMNYLQIGRTTPQMQTILQQILNCPYQSLTRQLYLEAKVLELMALRLEDLQDSIGLNTTILKPIQIDSIYQARDILISNFTNPPTLIALARQVNLNDCTLKKGFQQIFGTTVFGYLHNYRMEQAKELLLDAKLTVNQVAQYVGYASRSAFITAFCKKFGVSPSVYSRKNSV